MQTSVNAVGLDQIVMLADLGNALPRSRTIKRLARRKVLKPVGDRDRRTPFDQVVQSLLNLALGLGVDRGSHLVKYQDSRVDEQRSGDRNPLPLAARKGLARAFCPRANRIPTANAR